MPYTPSPIDTAGVALTADVEKLTESLAKNAHEHWAEQRLREGWRHGPRRDDRKKEHPSLVPYDELSESEKQYDRVTAMETIRAIVALGYKIIPPDSARSIGVDAVTAEEEALDAVIEYLQDSASLDMSVLLALWRNRKPQHWSQRPEVFRLLGERMLNFGEPLSAYDVVADGLSRWPEDVRLRQLAGLALARSGATERAVGILQKLLDEGHEDAETLGLFARTEKDLWERAADLKEKERRLRASFTAYDRAYAITDTYWTGINAATTALLSGKNRRAAELARRVQDQCSDEVVKLKARGGDLNSTRRNARLLLDHLRIEREAIESCFSLPRVHVFTGTVAARLVPTKIEFAADRSDEPARRETLRKEVERLDSRIAFSSAASGLDVLFLEVIQALKGETHVVLPYERAQFLADIAENAPNTMWADRYGRVLDRATSVVQASEHRRKASPMSFAYADRLLLGLAEIRAQQLGTDLRLISFGRGCSKEGMLEEAPVETPGHTEGWSDVLLQSDDERFPVEIKALLFADAVGFSKFSDEAIPLFVEHFLGLVARVERDFPVRPATKNTWGDGLYMVFHDVLDAALFALALRQEVLKTKWEALGLPKDFTLRIALHAGPVFRCTDPVTGVLSYFGTHVSRAARIEPITPAGEVYASQAYTALLALKREAKVACMYVGNTAWAKGYGSFPTFHVRLKSV